MNAVELSSLVGKGSLSYPVYQVLFHSAVAVYVREMARFT